MSDNKNKKVNKLNYKSSLSRNKKSSDKIISKKNYVKKAWKMSRVGIVGTPVLRIFLFLVILILPIIFGLFFLMATIVILSAGATVAINTLDGYEYSSGGSGGSGGYNGGSYTGRGLEVPPHLRGKLLVPTGDVITSLRGYRWGGEWHNGVDIARSNKSKPAPEVKPIYPGEVVEKQYHSSWGNTVVVKHDIGGEIIYSRYAHFSKIHVNVGDIVDYNTDLGTMGETGRSSGIHLHLEIYDDRYPNGAKWLEYSLEPLDFLTCDASGGVPKTELFDLSGCMDYRRGLVGN